MTREEVVAKAKDLITPYWVSRGLPGWWSGHEFSKAFKDVREMRPFCNAHNFAGSALATPSIKKFCGQGGHGCVVIETMKRSRRIKPRL